MKKLLTVFVVFVYFVPISLFIIIYQIATRESLQKSATLTVFTIPILFMIVACILVIINMVVASSSIIKSRCLSFRTVMGFKLCLIPFYTINFICWMFASMVFHIALVIWPLIPFIIAYTYFTMLGTSAYVIAKLFTLRRSKTITTKQFVTHCILQVVFTLDVIDSVYLAIKQKRLEAALLEQHK